MERMEHSNPPKVLWILNIAEEGLVFQSLMFSILLMVLIQYAIETEVFSTELLSSYSPANICTVYYSSIRTVPYISP